MICIEGIITKGESSASGKNMNWNGFGSIYHQVNFLKKRHPLFAIKLGNCAMATINVKLENTLEFQNWEYTFDKVFWLPNSDAWYEKISFIPIKFIFKNEQIDAWIYKAYKSPHKDNKKLLEIIAPYINYLNNDEICTIKIAEKYIE